MNENFKNHAEEILESLGLFLGLDDLEFGEIFIGGFDSVIRSFSQGITGGAAYYDAGGLTF